MYLYRFLLKSSFSECIVQDELILWKSIAHKVQAASSFLEDVVNTAVWIKWHDMVRI